MVRSRRWSMVRKRRAFSDEFKHQAVRRVRERTAIGVTLTQIGRELGVRPDLLRRWARLAKAQDTGVADGEEIVTVAELRRLRRENETLRQERDFAKKAAAFFAKELR
jgi:transposase